MSKINQKNCNPMVRFSGMNVAQSAKCGDCPACRAERKAAIKAQKEWRKRYGIK